MSRFVTEANGKYIEEIESIEVCKYRINEVCCNDKCDFCGDYPYYLKCDDKDVCSCFEKEDGII